MPKKFFLVMVISIVFLLPFTAEAQLPLPARIGGTVTVNGVQLTQETDSGYTFIATKGNGALYVPSAQDTDGLNPYNYYLIDMPIYDTTHQPEGAHHGDTAVIHAYKDGVELTVESPANGIFRVGESGSYTHIDLGVKTVNVSADLIITKDGPQSVTAGDPEPIIYAITVNNAGPSTAENVVLTDAIPSGLTNPEYSTDVGGTWQPWTGSLNLGNMEKDGTSGVLIRATVASSANGTIGNTAGISSETDDPDLTNNSFSETTKVNMNADLSVTKTTEATEPIIAGREITYIITVTNAGPSDASNVLVTDSIPVEILSPQYYDGSSWKEWQGELNIGALASGESKEVKIKGMIATSKTGILSNTVTVSSETDDPGAENNTHTEETAVTAEADVEVTKTGPPKAAAGEQDLIYTITVKNVKGPSDAANVTVYDDFPNGYGENVEYRIGSGEWKGITGDPVEIPIGSLGYGTTVTVEVRYDITTSTPTGTILHDVARATSETSDPDQTNNNGSKTDAQVDTIVEGNADLFITKTESPDPVGLGDEITYTITVTNAGLSDAVNVVLTDDVPSGINDPEYSTGDGNWFVWTGSLNLGNIMAGNSRVTLIKGTVDAGAPEVFTNAASVSSDTADPDPDNNSDSVDTENTIEDSDQDGMVDEWEQKIIDDDPNDDITTIYDVVPDDDFDNDGFTNIEEFNGETSPVDENDYPTRPYVETCDCHPYHGQGIQEGSLRIPNDTSVVIRMKDDTGIDETSIQMTVKGAAVSPVLKQLTVGDSKDYWVIYYPASAFGYEEVVDVVLSVSNVDGIAMEQYSYSFKVESEEEHNTALANMPGSTLGDSNPEEYILSANAGTDIEGAQIKYNPSEPVTPRFGPVGEIPEMTKANGVGMPVGLEPPTVFENPVTIFIPCPGESDVSTLDVYYYNPAEGWVKAGDADGWMVSGSRVDHNDTTAPTIEVQVNHFSAVQSGQGGIKLNSGWNLISFCKEPVDHAIENVLKPISGKYVSVWAFENNFWKVYDPGNPGFTDLTIISSGLGYWINMTEAATLPVTGTEAPTDIPLVKGWNLVGYPCCKSQPIEDALESIKGNYDLVWCFQNNSWKVYNPVISGLSDIDTMEPGYGYWIKVTENSTWTVICP